MAGRTGLGADEGLPACAQRESGKSGNGGKSTIGAKSNGGSGGMGGTGGIENVGGIAGIGRAGGSGCARAEAVSERSARTVVVINRVYLTMVLPMKQVGCEFPIR
jgi:hypothetical protein